MWSFLFGLSEVHALLLLCAGVPHRRALAEILLLHLMGEGDVHKHTGKLYFQFENISFLQCHLVKSKFCILIYLKYRKLVYFENA
jgi:hypothetical protein